MFRRRKAEPGPEVELPITPMLDMAFQLLAFFILTYHPSALEGQVALALPAAGQARAKDAKDVSSENPSDVDIEPPSELTVVIKRRQTGDGPPDRYLVESLQGTSQSLASSSALSDYLKKDFDRLKRERAPELRELREKQRTGSLTDSDKRHLKQLTEYLVKIRPDAQVKFAYVAEVMDACSRIGFNGIGFSPPPS
jgi:biopolymer transport protein ExbD